MGWVITRALHSVRALVDSSQARVEAAPLPRVSGDASMLVQLMQNLLENALKYRGTATPLVEISAEMVDGRCRFCVRDNGIGIDASQIERVFQPFHRVASGPACERGIGLGLATCRKIVERHGGKVWAESTLGNGSCFFFELLPASDVGD